ncbi:hypothetical protein QVD17_09395 [Tagetes erecta]|uniref:Uncharacterized protein n=1 Tax=Tagetes erecta TaxID=13708 RepID=A0AAD8P3X0_TARER|nr:hypothetical protein QVD17_09395 [Tagetes erecta]
MPRAPTRFLLQFFLLRVTKRAIELTQASQIFPLNTHLDPGDPTVTRTLNLIPITRVQVGPVNGFNAQVSEAEFAEGDDGVWVGLDFGEADLEGSDGYDKDEERMVVVVVVAIDVKGDYHICDDWCLMIVEALIHQICRPNDYYTLM